MRTALLLTVVLAACSAREEPTPATPPGSWDESVRLREPKDLNPDPNILEFDLRASVEELEVLPLCEQHFTDADWEETDAAFGGNGDPLLGIDQQTAFAELFHRIVRLAPPPIGVGSPTPADSQR